MKRIFWMITFVLCGLCTFYFLHHSHAKKKEKTPSSTYETIAESQKKPFVIVIPSFNNGEWCERNLHSVFDQKYTNFRVIYIDDCSTDDTYEKVCSLVKKYGQEKRVTLLRNENNHGALYNLYQAIHSCSDDEIVAILDGDDWFAHDQVLNRLNETYANPSVWMTYGSYLIYPSYKVGVCGGTIPKKILKENRIRTYEKKGFILSHLKTFYAALFKQIKQQDLIDQGNFLRSGYDLAIMYPMAEMAGKHIRYLKDPLYIYNRCNPLNDDKVQLDLQRHCASFVKSLPRYSRLNQLPLEKKENLSPIRQADFDTLMKDDFQNGSVQTLEDIENLYFFKNLYQKNHNTSDKISSIPKIIHFIWLGPFKLPEESMENINIWMKKHPGWTFQLWMDVDRQLPHPGLIKRHVCELPFQTLENCFYNSDNHGEKSQLLRYEILFKEGGVYVDLDTLPMMPLDDIHAFYDFYCGLEISKASILSSSIFPSNHLIAAKPHHPILEQTMQWLSSHWDKLGLYFPGDDEDALINRVYHRTLYALDHGIKAGSFSAENRDIIFPSRYFSYDKPKNGSYVTHQHSGLWHKRNATNEKKIVSYIKQIQKQDNATLLTSLSLIALSLLILFCLFLFIKVLNKQCHEK